MESKVFFIAEAGVNHNGSIKMAKELVDIAKNAGADCVKFQTFKAEELAIQSAKKAEYQIQNTKKPEETQFEMLKKLELSESDFIELKEYCDKKQIIFASTPFSASSFDFLESLNPKFIKISSGDLTNYPLLFYIAKAIAKKNITLIISTGMAEMEEIKNAVGIISAGFLELEKPDIANLEEYTKKALKLINERLSVLHCTTNYPANIENINLNSIPYLKEELNLKNIGYSDHTTSLEVPMYASFAGATIIEKHFTISKKLEGPDHIASLEPKELKKAIENVRYATKILGQYSKHRTKEEEANVTIARKGIYIKTNIKEGEIFTEESFVLKRPYYGKNNLNYWNLIGTKATKNYTSEQEI